MSTAPPEEPPDRAAAQPIVRFTARGEAALDELADALIADYTGSTEDISQVLGQVLHTDMTELASALTATTAAAAGRGGPDETAEPGFDAEATPAAGSPDDAARRRRDRHQDTPPVGENTPSRTVAR